MLLQVRLAIACLLHLATGQMSSETSSNMDNRTQEPMTSTSTVPYFSQLYSSPAVPTEIPSPTVSGAISISSKYQSDESTTTARVTLDGVVTTTSMLRMSQSSVDLLQTSAPLVATIERTSSSSEMLPSIGLTSVHVPPISSTTCYQCASSVPAISSSALPTSAPSASTGMLAPVTSAAPATTSIPSVPTVVTSSAPHSSPSSAQQQPTASTYRGQTTSSQQTQAMHQSPVSIRPTMEALVPTSLLQAKSSPDITIWQVSVAILAVLAAVFLTTSIVLSIALCIAICRFRSRNLTYTINKNPEAKENKYWIETKPNQTEDKISPTPPSRLEEGGKVWYSENATAFPVFPMVHLAAAKDTPTDASPSVQTFRLARAYKQSTGAISTTTTPPPAAGNNTTSALSPKSDTEASNSRTAHRDTLAEEDGESVRRTIEVPTTPTSTSESDLSKGKKRRPPPLKPIGGMQAEAQAGTYTKQVHNSNPTTPGSSGSCSVHKSQVNTSDPRAELMREYSAILQGKQNPT